MVKLAPMLEEIPEDICVSGHERSGSHDRKLHQAFPLSRGGGIGPESITLKSEMANHNSRGINKGVVDYTGRVWCPEVAPHHTVIARRNGKVFISYQSNEQEWSEFR